MKRDLPKDRPPPLKITRPGDPLHHQHHQLQEQQRRQQQQQQQQYAQHPGAPFRPANPNYRQPVIIHTYSPEVIQIDSDNFRREVQRLTGAAGLGSSSSHAPPPPKRARVAAPLPAGNFNPNFSSAHGSSSVHGPQIVPHPVGASSPQAQALRNQQEGANPYMEASSSYGNLPPNPLLSPSMFDFSPSVLPSPSTFSFDFPAMISPMGLRGGGAAAGLPSPLLPGRPSSLASPRGLPTPRSLAAALPSPGPLSANFLADLPVLSPAAYSWIEKNAATADAILSSSRAAADGILPAPRAMMSAGLPPRPPPTTTANLFPSSLPEEDEKPFLYREK